MSNAVCKESWSSLIAPGYGRFYLAVGLVVSADHEFYRHLQSSTDHYWSLPLIDPWALLSQHLNWLSINTWWTTFQSTVSQQLTNFCRHAINTSAVNQYIWVGWLSTNCWSSVDQVSIKCWQRRWLMLAEYQPSGHWDVYQMLIECIHWHPTADASTTHGPISPTLALLAGEFSWESSEGVEMY